MRRKSILYSLVFLIISLSSITLAACGNQGQKSEQVSPSVASSSPSTPTPQGVYYTIENEDTLVIQGKGKVERELIRTLEFDVLEKIQKIKIEDGVTELDNRCFQSDWDEFINVKEVWIGNDVNCIGKNCFGDMYNLTTVHMGERVEKVDDFAFSDCESLEYIDFSPSLKEIGKYVFMDCIGLKKIIFPDSVRKIGAEAFVGCYNLEELTLPADLKKWGRWTTDFAGLRTVINRSQKEWELPSKSDNIRWYIEAEKVDKIPPGTTATSEGKVFSITYKLNGGRLVGKLPKSYRFGEASTISATAEKEGYYCVGWYGNGKARYFCEPYQIEKGPGRSCDSGDMVLEPLFVKYQIESSKPQTMQVVVSDDGLPVVADYYEIRYSENEDMSDAKSEVVSGAKSEKVTFSNLESGKRYYVEFRWGGTDGEDGLEPESPWMAKRSIVVK